MPTYQYSCTACGEPLEVVQKFTDDALTECPACGGQLRKLYNAVGIVFKGSGFYRTDSRSGSSATVPAGGAGTPGSSADSKSSSDSGSSTDSGSPSTPAQSTGAPAASGSTKSTTTGTSGSAA